MSHDAQFLQITGKFKLKLIADVLTIYLVPWQDELAAQRQDFGAAKERSFRNKVKIEKQTYLAKMTSAEQTKEERVENQQRLAEYKMTRRLNAMEKKDAVKKLMLQSQRKLDSLRMQKIQAVSPHTHCKNTRILVQQLCSRKSW